MPVTYLGVSSGRSKHLFSRNSRLFLRRDSHKEIHQVADSNRCGGKDEAGYGGRGEEGKDLGKQTSIKEAEKTSNKLSLEQRSKEGEGGSFIGDFGRRALQADGTWGYVQGGQCGWGQEQEEGSMEEVRLLARSPLPLGMEKT